MIWHLSDRAVPRTMTPMAFFRPLDPCKGVALRSKEERLRLEKRAIPFFQLEQQDSQLKC